MINRDCRCPGCGTCESAANIKRVRLEYGQQRARNAVFMQCMAVLAKDKKMQTFARYWVDAADNAAKNVRPEDFVNVNTN